MAYSTDEGHMKVRAGRGDGQRNEQHSVATRSFMSGSLGMAALFLSRAVQHAAWAMILDRKIVVLHT